MQEKFLEGVEVYLTCLAIVVVLGCVWVAACSYLNWREDRAVRLKEEETESERERLKKLGTMERDRRRCEGCRHPKL